MWVCLKIYPFNGGFVSFFPSVSDLNPEGIWHTQCHRPEWPWNGDISSIEFQIGSGFSTLYMYIYSVDYWISRGFWVLGPNWFLHIAVPWGTIGANSCACQRTYFSRTMDLWGFDQIILHIWQWFCYDETVLKRCSWRWPSAFTSTCPHYPWCGAMIPLTFRCEWQVGPRRFNTSKNMAKEVA